MLAAHRLSPRFSLRRSAVVVLLLSPLAGCRANAPSSAPAPRLDDIAAIEAELADNNERLQAQGLYVPAPTPAPVPADPMDYTDEEQDGDDEAAAPVMPSPPPEPATEAKTTAINRSERERDARGFTRKREEKRAQKDRCERICDLAETTCDLSARICALADEHVDDVRYEEACDRAKVQCEIASEACDDC